MAIPPTAPVAASRNDGARPSFCAPPWKISDPFKPLAHARMMDTATRVGSVWKGRKSSRMSKAKEFTVTIEDKPGALGRRFLALAERGVNILAFQSYVEEGESLARLIVDDPASAKAEIGRAHV